LVEAEELTERETRALCDAEGEIVSRSDGVMVTEGDRLKRGDLEAVPDAEEVREVDAEVIALGEAPPVTVLEKVRALVTVPDEEPLSHREAVITPLTVAPVVAEPVLDKELAAVALTDAVSDLTALEDAALEADAETVPEARAEAEGPTVSVTLAVAELDAAPLPVAPAVPVTEGACVTLIVSLREPLKEAVPQALSEDEGDARVLKDVVPLPVPSPPRAVPVGLCVTVTSDERLTVDDREGAGERVDEPQPENEGEAEGLSEADGERDTCAVPDGSRVGVLPGELVRVTRAEEEGEGLEEALPENDELCEFEVVKGE
jgi:hypothetical protein